MKIPRLEFEHVFWTFFIIIFICFLIAVYFNRQDYKSFVARCSHQTGVILNGQGIRYCIKPDSIIEQM